MSWIDQLLGAATPSVVESLEATPERLRLILQELLTEISRKTIRVSLWLLLLHVPMLALALHVGHLGAGLTVLAILLTVHLAVLGAALRPSLVEFESPALAYSFWRLAGLCYLGGIASVIWLPFVSNGHPDYVVLLVLAAIIAPALFSVASPLAVFSWLNRTAHTLERRPQWKSARTVRPAQQRMKLPEPGKQPLPPPEAKAPESPASWTAQFFGAMGAVVLLIIYAQIYRAVTGHPMTMPFAPRPPLQQPQVPVAPVQPTLNPPVYR